MSAWQKFNILSWIWVLAYWNHSQWADMSLHSNIVSCLSNFLMQYTYQSSKNQFDSIRFDTVGTWTHHLLYSKRACQPIHYWCRLRLIQISIIIAISMIKIQSQSWNIISWVFLIVIWLCLWLWYLMPLSTIFQLQLTLVISNLMGPWKKFE
jgi:hypothetical protein